MVSSKSRFTKNQTNSLQSKYLVNEQIKSDKVFTITHQGENLGEITKQKALSLF